MGTVELSKTLREIKAYQHLQEEITAELDALKDAVKAELTARNIDELTAGDYRASWKAIVTSRLDGSALKAAAPELFARFSKTTETRRFTVS